MQRSSEELLAAARGGDRPAIEELLLRHLPGLRAFVRLRAGPLVRRREAESDLVQSVCREVLLHAGDFRHGGEPGFRHWLYATAVRKILNKQEFHTAQRRDLGAEESPGAEALLDAYGTFSSPSRHLATAEELARIEQAFDALPEDYREVVLLSRVVGLPRAEVARAMDRSEGAVRNLLHRALATLSQRLDMDDA
jgi:RNA polymerase sigma-70 factor, ECF subfamily